MSSMTRLAGIVAFACVASAQEDLAAVLASFPDDGIPRALAGLREPQFGPALVELKAAGKRAHRFLLGALRGDPPVAFVANQAFGAVDAEDAWLLPALVAADNPDASLFAAIGEARLAVRPRIDVLPRIPGSVTPVPVAAATADEKRVTATTGRRIAAHWREPLLAILADHKARASWWPAVQALQTIDDAACIDAAVILAQATVGEDAERARELLLALRYGAGAVAMRRLTSIVALPDELQVAALRRTALAFAAKARVGNSDQTAAHAALAASTDPEVRRALLAGELVTAALGQPLADGSIDLHAMLDQDPDARVRDLARALQRVEAAVAQPLFAEPLTADASRNYTAVQRLRRLSDAALAECPIDRVEELVALCVPVPPAAGAGLGGDLLRTAAQAAQRPLPVVLGATELLQRLASCAPRQLLAVAAKHPDRVAPLAEFLLRANRIAPAMRGWLLDNVHVADDPTREFVHLPIDLAPALIVRLTSAPDAERAARLLRQGCNYVDWADVCATQAESIADCLPRLPPDRQRDLAHVLAVGKSPGHAALRRLIATPTLTHESRLMLLEQLAGSGSDPTPAAFVLALLQERDAAAIPYALHLATTVQDDRVAVADALAELARDNAGWRRDVAYTLARMNDRRAIPWLETEITATAGSNACFAAATLLDLDIGHGDARKVLDAAITSPDDHRRSIAWQAISLSPGAAVLFLDRIDALLDPHGQVDGGHRVTVLLTTAFRLRPAEVTRRLAELTRHPDANLSQCAEQVLVRLRKDQTR
jgi:hypothetical protein